MIILSNIASVISKCIIIRRVNQAKIAIHSTVILSERKAKWDYLIRLVSKCKSFFKDLR